MANTTTANYDNRESMTIEMKFVDVRTLTESRQTVKDANDDLIGVNIRFFKYKPTNETDVVRPNGCRWHWILLLSIVGQCVIDAHHDESRRPSVGRWRQQQKLLLQMDVRTSSSSSSDKSLVEWGMDERGSRATEKISGLTLCWQSVDTRKRQENYSLCGRRNEKVIGGVKNDSLIT